VAQAGVERSLASALGKLFLKRFSRIQIHEKENSVCQLSPFDRCHLRDFQKRLAAALSAPSARELTDVLVIFSITFLTYKLVADWGGMTLLQLVFGTQAQKPSFLYFFGMALVLFSLRRIGDQRSERAKRVAAEVSAQTMSMRDPLTQLPNRRQFQIDVSAALKNSDNKMSVLLLGIDQFKKLNEVYGHVGCDEALLQIGSRIRERAAAGDTFARIGDDEFALCLAGSDPDSARRIACTLVEAVKRPVQIGIEQHSLGASVGIAQTGRGHATVDELLRCAHVALSRARTIHTEFCFFDPKMDAHIRERSLLEKDLRAAVGGNGLQPYYQPIVDLKTRRIVSFESLARWHNPVSGLILPDTFIPLAEELGILDVISGQLFGDACRAAATWPEDISLTFNFSPSQFSDRSFADAILMVLRDTGLPAHRLEAEITESALVEDLESTRHAIQTLRNAGVRIVIDDFGTGYSSLYHLYELRFDKLKIDKRFIAELVTTGESAVFIRAMVGLSKGLNLFVTAEGIETEAQATAAMQHGVDQAQGFLYGRAVPGDQVPKLLSAQLGSAPLAVIEAEPAAA
jgi:diguanylate cyclase (GGDEF)-like protein